MKKYISLDIGGTMIKHGIIEEGGVILEYNETKTEASLGGRYLLNKVIKLCEDYISNNEISGICISTAGIVDPISGEIIYANSSIPNYMGINYKQDLERIFNVICQVENDVNCAGLSESFIGAGKEASSVLCLTIGTGIGGCIIIDKKIINGFSNSACEVGYMNMFGSNFQDLASSSVLVKNVVKRLNLDSNHIDGKIIFERAKDGDLICIEEIDNLCNILGYGISNICYVLNPQVVILGGGIMAQKDYLYDRILKSLKQNLIEPIFKNTKLEFAKNGNKAGMLGAYYNFLQRL